MLQDDGTTNNDEEEIIFCMGQAEGGFDGMDTSDLAKLAQRPQRLLKNSLRNEVFTRDLLKEIEFNNNGILSSFFNDEEFEIQIPEFVSAKIDNFFNYNSVIKEQNFFRMYETFKRSYYKTKKGYRLKQCSDAEKKALYNFLFSSGFLENRVRIFPSFKKVGLEKSYLFYSPLYSGTDKAYRGCMIICFSFVDIIKQVHSRILTFLIIVFLSTLVAVIWSIFSALAFSSTLVKPLQQMCGLVKVISETEDFESLKGTQYEKLNIQSGDEIEDLAKDINMMTGNLIEKSKSDKQLLLGKEIQEKFIPLFPVKNKNIEIFGFYEGAKGVSGDYFDYKKINDDCYIFIMCDVAGKGVPAALIMVEIFALFHSLCNKENNTAYIVQQINDILAEKGFTGRFASIIILSLNIITGEMRFTSAGYSELFIYKHKTARCRKFKLPKTGPAAGVFHSSLLPEPYCEMKSYLDYEDIILLFSDGIEESRNGKFSIDNDNCKHFEEFGQERLINAVNSSMKKTPDGIIVSLLPLHYFSSFYRLLLHLPVLQIPVSSVRQLPSHLHLMS
jgi:serine phosphatase RsbU (regulator of sigma subunit)